MAKENAIPKEILIAASAAEQVRQREAQKVAVEDSEMENKQNAMTALGAMAAMSGSQSSAPDELQSRMMKTLIENLEHDMSKKRAKEDQEEEEHRRLMLARVASIKQEKAQRAYTQSVCDHRKENGHSRICGQKLSNGHLSLLCNLCYKEFSEETLPPHLQISSELIGG
jgi:hypothetical protein